MQISKSESAVSFNAGEEISNSMTADLGLFYQLLEMIDGDWSDSIQGICNHIREKFDALAVFLSVFDKKYMEFIYIAFAVKNELIPYIQRNNILLTKEAALDIIKKVYSKRRNILEYGIFENEEIYDLAAIYFDNDKKKARDFISETSLKTVFAIPDLDASNDYTCFFHILTDRKVEEKEKNLINDYLTQLHVALEIVFLVRDLYIKATHDSLTKLFNHKQGNILLNKEIDRVQRNKQPLSLVMVDIDFFKRVNDSFGHQAGNEVLVYLSSLLTRSLRKCDIVSRCGGEEFMLVLPDTDLKGSLEVMKRLKDSIEDHFFLFSKKKCRITASFGIAQFDADKNNNAAEIIRAADQNLYRAKEKGRNRIEY